MKGMDKKIKRAVSGTLAAVMAASAGIASFGAAGVPVCDEAMYVTMDPYGGISEASVVKSYELHGAREITDRGTYQAVGSILKAAWSRRRFRRPCPGMSPCPTV